MIWEIEKIDWISEFSDWERISLLRTCINNCACDQAPKLTKRATVTQDYIIRACKGAKQFRFRRYQFKCFKLTYTFAVDLKRFRRVSSWRKFWTHARMLLRAGNNYPLHLTRGSISSIITNKSLRNFHSPNLQIFPRFLRCFLRSEHFIEVFKNPPKCNCCFWWYAY